MQELGVALVEKVPADECPQDYQRGLLETRQAHREHDENPVESKPDESGAGMAADCNRPAGPVVRRDEREHVTVSGAVALCQADAAHEERGGERVRGRCVGAR